jgi:hypothetical protein
MKRYVIVRMEENRYMIVDRWDDYCFELDRLKEILKDVPETDIEYPEGWEH